MSETFQIIGAIFLGAIFITLAILLIIQQRKELKED